MKHKLKVDDLVIDIATGERGTIKLRLPPQGQGPNRYRVQIDSHPGRPRGRPGRPIVPPGPGKPEVTIDETVLRPGMNPTETTSADNLMVDSLRTMLAVDRTGLRAAKEIIQDDGESTDHEAAEAERYLVALDILDAE